jgi:hypothetical protein
MVALLNPNNSLAKKVQVKVPPVFPLRVNVYGFTAFVD